MLTTEYSARWLPIGTLASDSNSARRVEVVQNGVFWGDSNFADPDSAARHFGDWFLPWNWTLIGQWRCYSIDAQGTVNPYPAGDLTVQPQQLDDWNVPSSALAGHYLREIGHQVMESSGQGLRAREICRPLNNLVDHETIDDTSPPVAYTGWLRGYLAQKAQAMHPANIKLKMAWLSEPVDINVFDPAFSYTWLPVFDSADNWDDEPAPAQAIEATGHLRGDYSAGTQAASTALAALATPVAAPRPAQQGNGSVAHPEQIIRYEADTESHQPFSPLRLRGPSLIVSDTQEWLTGLSQRAAGAIDLPQFLLAWLKFQMAKGSELLKAAENGSGDIKNELAEFLNLCRDYLIAASRDVIGFGRIPGPDRRHLAEDIWLRAKAENLWFITTPPSFVDGSHVTDAQKNRSLRNFADALFEWEDTNNNRLLDIWNAALDKICGTDLANPLDRWSALGPRSAVNALAVEEFILAAETYVDFVRQPDIARKMIRYQWLILSWTGLKSEWIEESLKALADPARDQAEGLLDRYWQGLFAGQDSADEANRQKHIAQMLLTTIRKPQGAWDNRFDPHGELYPRIAEDPFLAIHSGSLQFLSRNQFMAYIEARFGINDTFPSASSRSQPPAMEHVAAVLFPNRNQVYPAPQAIRIAVDQPAAGNIDGNQAVDLNDELAGVLLFVRESNSTTWRSLNLAEAWIVENGTAPADPLAHVFLTASPIGEQDGARVAYRRFDNECPGIIASPENHETTRRTPEEEAADQLESEKNRLVMRLPRTHTAPCTQYGHDYLIAGAAMTNGGVLPAVLRADPADAGSLARPLSTGWTSLGTAFGEAEYQCRRRVPVGPIRFAPLHSDEAQEELFPIPRPLPSALPVAGADRRQDESNRGIRPIACELPEWASDDPNKLRQGADAQNGPKQNLLLIFPGSKPASVTGGIFGSFRFHLLKPTTGFWNWFAWMDDWTTCPEETRVDEWENEMIQRQTDNQRQTGLGPLDDPAAENEIYCEVECLFPAVQRLSPIHVPYGPERTGRPGRSGPVTVSVVIGNALNFTAAQGALTVEVPQGMVLRLTVYSVVPLSQFVPGGAAPPKFHGFMMDPKFIPGAKEILNSANEKCVALTPVELFIEAAANWQTSGLQQRIETALWQGLQIATPDIYELAFHNLSTNGDPLPTSGRRQVIVKDIGGSLHFRIFDSDRVIAIDLPEDKLPLTDEQRAIQVTELRNELAAWTSSPTSEGATGIIRRVASMTAWKKDRKLLAGIDRSLDFEALAQVGRLDVWHQIWRWDGREVPSDLLDRMLQEQPSDRDLPDSISLEWDGVAFPTRPDYAHRSSPASLAVWRQPASTAAGVGIEKSQDIFSDNLADDLRAIYYRLSVRGFSRYEAVMGDDAVLASEVVQNSPLVRQPWRRALVKSTRSTKLSKPSVRFALPLTRDVFDTETGAQTAASVMLVLDDISFAESGLADRFEVGVRVLTDPNQNGSRWVNAGFDPTLTDSPLNDSNEPTEIRQITRSLLGPYGLTHDYAAKTPKLRGSCFILRIPLTDLPEIPEGSSGKLPWFMCEIVTRRVLREHAVDLPRGIEVNDLTGEWSARTWVQFVPNTELLWPPAWRSACSGSGPKTIQLDRVDSELVCTIPELTKFDESFEERHERWLVLSEQITDIKRLPAENYLATFVDEGTAGLQRFLLRDGETSLPASGSTPRRGYLRLLLVRRRKGDGPLSPGLVWQSIFATEADHQDPVMDDVRRMMPIVTPRVPVVF